MGDLVRTSITGVGIILLLFAYEVPQRLNALIRRQQIPASPFSIVYGENGIPYVRREDEYSSSGLLLGHRNIWYLMVHNVGLQTLTQIEASIAAITPIPSETQSANHIIHRTIPLPQRLKFGNECSAPNIQLTPGDLVQLRYASYMNSAISPKRIRLEGSNREFYPDDNEPYILHIRITGDNVAPASAAVRIVRRGEQVEFEPLSP